MEYEAFVVYIAIFSIDLDDKVHPAKKTQIAHLKVHKALTKVSNEYTNFANIFLPQLAIEFSEHMEINDYTIELVDD